MKKFTYNILYIAVLSLFVSCVDQQFEPAAIKEVKATISNFDYEPINEARISYSLGESGYEAKWSDGDVLGIYPVGGEQVAFPISDGTGASCAVFDGGAWALKSSYAYAAYYPYSISNITVPESQIPVTYVGQTQTGNNTFTHFSSYDYLASKATHPDSDGNVSLQMKHVGSFFLLKLTMPKAGTYTKLALTSDNKEFTTQGTLDLTSTEPGITPTSTSKTITINLKDVTLAKDNELLTVNLMVAPKDLSGSNITIKITDDEGNMYSTTSNQHITGKKYEANKTYSFTRNMVATGQETSSTTEQGHNLEPYFSETVELMGLIWRLAGSYEYNLCEVSSISRSADTYFASMINHRAVTLAKQYMRGNVNHDAVTAYGNQLFINELGVISFDSNYLEGSDASFDRWSEQQKIDMLVAVRDFYEVSNFHDWFVSTLTEQQQAIASFKSICNLDYTWFDSYYGTNEKISSRIILSFMIGGHNYGLSLKRADGTFLLTPVLGGLAQHSGSVIFYGDMNLIVHEFSHPYCNPLIDANWAAIEKKANEVYEKVGSIMASNAYSIVSMMYETLVRASAIRYMMSHNMEDLAEQTTTNEVMGGFIMVRKLVEILEKYEQSTKYATLADFMPEIVDAINNFDPNNISDPDGTAEPDKQPHEYVDLGIEMDDGKKLYFATRNVGETSPDGIASTVYRWGATIEWGKAWTPEVSETPNEDWPAGHKLDAEHDIATIQWGGDWHTPSVEEWKLLVEKCDYERKEFDESGYGVSGYYFYNKSDRSKFIFIPFAAWDLVMYWTSDTEFGHGANTIWANHNVVTTGTASLGFELAIRPVITASGTFDANGHDYVDLGIQTSDSKKLYFATMNVGETSPGGISAIYSWGATKEGGEPWIPEVNPIWPVGKKLDAAHDIATIKWGEKWHTPSPEEWKLLVEKCDYERKEADKSGYDVAGYFFYNKKDHSKYIFLPVSLWSDELEYWTSVISEPEEGICVAHTFNSSKGNVGCIDVAPLSSRGYAVRPVFAE